MSKPISNLNNFNYNNCCYSKPLKGRDVLSSAVTSTITQIINQGTTPSEPVEQVIDNLTVTQTLTSLLDLIANNISVNNLNINNGSLLLNNNTISSNGDIILDPTNSIDPNTGEETGSVIIRNNLLVEGSDVKLCINNLAIKDPVPIIGFCDNDESISDNNNDLGFQFVYARLLNPPTPTVFNGFFGYDKNRSSNKGRFVFWQDVNINVGTGFDQNYNRDPTSAEANELDSEFIHTCLITTLDDPNSPIIFNGVYQKKDINIEVLNGDLKIKSDNEIHNIDTDIDVNVKNIETHIIGNNTLDPGRFIVKDILKPTFNIIDLDCITSGNKRLLLSNENKIDLTTNCGIKGNLNIDSGKILNLLAETGTNIINEKNNLFIKSGSNILNNNGYILINSESSVKSSTSYSNVSGRIVIAGSNGVIIDGGGLSSDSVTISPKLLVNTINELNSNFILSTSSTHSINLTTSNANINLTANGSNKSIVLDPGLTFINNQTTNPNTSALDRTIYYDNTSTQKRIKINEDPILIIPSSNISSVVSNGMAVFQSGSSTQEHKIISTNITTFSSGNSLLIPGILEVNTINEESTNLLLSTSSTHSINLTTSNANINLTAGGSNKSIVLDPGLTFINNQTTNPNTSALDRTIYYDNTSTQKRIKINEDPILVIPSSNISSVVSNGMAVFQSGSSTLEHKIISTNITTFSSGNSLLIPGILEVNTINEESTNLLLSTSSTHSINLTTSNANINLTAGGSNKSIVLDPGLTFINNQTTNPNTSALDRTMYYDNTSTQKRIKINEDPILVLPEIYITNVVTNCIPKFQNGSSTLEHKLVPTELIIDNSGNLFVPYNCTIDGKLISIDVLNNVAADRLIIRNSVIPISKTSSLAAGFVLTYNGTELTLLPASGSSTLHTLNTTYSNGSSISDQTINLLLSKGGGLLIKDAFTYSSSSFLNYMLAIKDLSNNNYMEVIKNGSNNVNINLGSTSSPIKLISYGSSTSNVEALNVLTTTNTSIFKIYNNPSASNKHVMINGRLNVTNSIYSEGLLLYGIGSQPALLPTTNDGIIWVDNSGGPPGILYYTNSINTYPVVQDLQNVYDNLITNTLVITDLEFTDGSTTIFSLKTSPSLGEKQVNVYGDLKVTGLIDPIGLVISKQTISPNGNLTNSDGLLWINSNNILKFETNGNNYDVVQDLQNIYNYSINKEIELNGNGLLFTDNSSNILNLTSSEISTDCQNVNINNLNGKIIINNQQIITTRQPNVNSIITLNTNQINLSFTNNSPILTNTIIINDGNNILSTEISKTINTNTIEINNIIDDIINLKDKINEIIIILQTHGLIG
jgi:hypothetical protein